jgi:hypothetical protein
MTDHALINQTAIKGEDLLMNGSITRREFIRLSGTALGAAALLGSDAFSYANALKVPGDTWNQGDLIHIIPMVNHECILLKTSFQNPQGSQLRLRVNDRKYSGKKSDIHGRFWQFEADGLEPAREYTLQIVDDAGRAICDPWPLKTYPDPEAPVEHVRLLAYT